MIDSRVVLRHHLIWLAVILAAGLALRVASFRHATASPGYVWEDPDGYVTQALKLAGHGSGWRWTFDAVTYNIEGRRHALPPGYSIFLSAFALFPSFPFTAQVAQILLSLVAIALVFELGRLLHSTATGLVAAAGYAVWVPNIFNVWSTSQETLYLPLLLGAFVLLAHALRTDAKWIRFAIIGLAFGACALTRSMPMFFIVPGALTIVAFAADRRRAAQQAAALVVGFLIVTVPYSAALSRHFGRLAVIDTHGSIHLEVAPGQDAPGLVETAAALARAAFDAPVVFGGELVERARSLLYVNGGRILQIYVVAGNRAEAAAWKTLVHTGGDGLLVVAALLAPIGAALCRDRRLAAILLVWAAVNIGIASLGGFGGARLRAPFEPLMVLLAAVVFTGGWQRPRAAAAACALAFAAIAGAAVVPQIPRSLRAWPDYGVQWPSILSRHSGRLGRGSAGFNVAAPDGFGEFSAATQDGSAATITVRARGVPVGAARLAPGDQRRFRTMWPGGGLAFVEVDARRDDGSPAAIAIAVQR